MKRREVLKGFALLAAGAFLLPGCGFGGEKTGGKEGQNLLSAKQQDLLSHLTETLIPATDTPGAKELELDRLVNTMMNDCYAPLQQQNFLKGLQATEDLAKKENGKSFAECDKAGQLAVLNGLSTSENPETKAFYELLKELTVTGYLKSEYVMINISKFQMAPGFYHGCVAVQA